MKIAKAIFCQEDVGDHELRAGSKKSTQQGRSQFCARSVLALRERSRPEEGQVCEPEGPENWRERRWGHFSTDLSGKIWNMGPYRELPVRRKLFLSKGWV